MDTGRWSVLFLSSSSYCSHWQTLLRCLLMTEVIFTLTSVNFLLLLSYSVEQLI
jgi:hypothetical protein